MYSTVTLILPDCSIPLECTICNIGCTSKGGGSVIVVVGVVGVDVVGAGFMIGFTVCFTGFCKKVMSVKIQVHTFWLYFTPITDL